MIFSFCAHASCANGLSPLIPYTAALRPMYAFTPALTSHISAVHTLVNAMGKKSNSVFLLSKLSLSRICFVPAGTFVDKLKSGALVPTASGICESFRCDFGCEIHYRFGMQGDKDIVEALSV